MSPRNIYKINTELLLFYTGVLIFVILDKIQRGESLRRRISTSLGERSTVVSLKSYESVTGRLIIDVTLQIFVNSQLKTDIDIHAVASTSLLFLVSQPKNCSNLFPSPLSPNAVIVHRFNLILLDDFVLGYVAVLITSEYG